MKKAFLFILFSVCVYLLNAQTIPVTFHLDANNTQYQTVKIWNGSTHNYTDDDGDRIFELTLDLQPGKFDYYVLRDEAWGWDPDNPLNVGQFSTGQATMNVADPMISYLLPKDNDMMRENHIQADFAYTVNNPPLANSISVTINGNSIVNPSQYFNAAKRQLYIANPPYLLNGSNTVTVAYSTNKGSISSSSTFSYQPIKLMIDTMVYRMDHILGWGRVFEKPYPALVFLKCNDKTYTATVNSEGYFGADIDILNGENFVKVAYSEAGLTNPTDQMTVNAEIRAKWWVELTGSISGSTATIQTVAHDINQSELTFSWGQSEDNPAGLSVSGNSPSLSFTVPTQEGNYEIELHVTAANGEDYFARKMLTTNGTPHFIGVNERAPWMETMVLYEIEADFFDWGKLTFQNIKQTFQHIKDLGANTFRITPFVSGGFISWDHFEINPSYGSINDLSEMIETAHQYGIKVLFDVPLSHTAPFHPFILPNFLLKEKAEPYYDFSLWKGNPGESDVVISPDNGRQCVYTNLENGYTQEYFTRLMEYWVEVAGADGFRIDCGQESINRSPDYVKYLHKRLRNINPDLFILEEGENRGHPAVDYYDFGDAVYDWKLYGWNNSEGFPGIFSGTFSVDQLHELLTTGTPDSGLVMRYINTGYFEYFSKRFGAEQERSGVAIINTTYGLPNIRAGEEVGLARSNGMADFTDPNKVMPFYTRLIKARKELLGNYPVIERITQNIPEKVYAYTAKSNGKIVMTVVNFSASQTNVTIDLANPVFENKGKTNWYNIVEDITTDNSSKTTLTIALAPWKAEVFAINCTKDDVFPPATSIVLNSVTGENSIETNGGSLDFMALIYPENSMDSIIWGLEGDTLLAALSDGTLTACGCGEGEVTVIARSEKNPSVEAQKTIQIKNQFSGQVSNSTFDSNVNDWFLWSPGCNSRFEWDNGTGHLIYNNGSSICYSQLMTTNNMTIVSGKKYRVRFNARATGNSTIKCTVRKNGDGYGSLSTEPEFQITTASKSFEFEFVAVTSSAIAQLQFNVGGGNAGFWFDNVSFCEIFESDSVNVTFNVDMQNETVSAKGVHIGGSFENLGELDANGSVYSATIKLKTGETLPYKFINGELYDWAKYETITGTCTTGDAGDRWLLVPDNDITLDVVCFGSCGECVPVVVSDSVNVTFRVDMQNETVSAAGVNLSCFNNFSVSKKMQLASGGVVYATTLTMKKGENIEYKFVNGAKYDWAKYETITGNCVTGDGNNRFLIVPDNDVTLDVVCFSSCGVCEPMVVSDSVNVTFRVDMQNETVSAAGVNLSCFNNFSVSKKMQLASGGVVYATTLTMKKGENIQYKFVNGASDDWAKYETITGSCVTGDGNNRFLIVPDNDVTLDVVCFSSCGECEPMVVSDSVDVTFRVDMQNETVSAAGVNVNGSFSNWSAAKQMQLFSGGVVYATSLKLKKGETIEYKFINGGTSDWNKYELIDGICAFGNDKNRMLVVPENDVILDVVCFGTCASCENILPSNAGIISGTTIVCQEQNSVTYTVPTIANATSYLWTLPTGTTGTSITNSITVNYGTSASSGNITVKGHNANGDGASSSLSITVNTKPPTPVISQNGELLHSNATNGNQWYNQSGALNGASNQDYSPVSSGNYYVIVYLNGCNSNSSNSFNFIPVEIDLIEANKKVKVYPNPSSGEVYVKGLSRNTDNLILLISATGQVIQKVKSVDQSDVKLNLSYLPMGVYTIKIISSEGDQNFKVVRKK